ncbi:MAG: flagella basal body P-ring formation protein FlgA [Sphingomonadaceae bacterium]|nr:flagella basal body P-ring formation protein FlgA [Sphingomonadaceae bacterium]
MSFSLTLLAAATPVADLNAIDRRVAGFTGAAIGQAGGATGPVDRRLRLRPCVSRLNLSWRTGQRQSVVVQCAGGWRLFVPVKSAGPVAAALPAVSRGDTVTIAVSGDGFTVSRAGEALETGAVGAWIKVRKISDSRRFGNGFMRAKVIRPGLVGLPLP